MLATLGPRLGAVAGLLAAALSLGIAQFIASFVGAYASPIVAVGSRVIDATPEGLKSFAIATFGSNDKAALVATILVILAVASMVIGALATRWIGAGWAGVGLFGLVGGLAVLARPGATPGDVVPVVVGSVSGIIALTAMVRPLDERQGVAPGVVQAVDQNTATPAAIDVAVVAGRTHRDVSRRRFLTAAAAVGGLAFTSGGAGLLALGRRGVGGGGPTVSVPQPASTAVPVPQGADLALPDLSTFITPNADFYRVDTAILPPVVDAGSWRLHIHGMVERELTLDLPQLLAMPTIERDITLTCVSNVVGGPYAGNARWIGVPLKALLDEAGVAAGADQLVSRSIDGFTVGTPIAAVMDGRDAMLAVAMNGRSLPVEHGYPVRMIVPGLYGYVSATKWLVDLELTTFAAFDPYWVERGWARQAPIKTMARIDTPRALSIVPGGPVVIAGVAWAQRRGISKVEVRVDDGPWSEATLAAADGIDTWRQWAFGWAAASGRHTISARATDGLGAVQTDVRADPFPDGASGWQSLVVTIS